jgi:hypothetical protein
MIADSYDASEYWEVTGNYYGVEARGVSPASVTILDRVRPGNFIVENTLNVDGVIASAGDYVVICRPNEKAYIYKNFAKGVGIRTSLLLEELPWIDEVAMLYDEKNQYIIMLMRRAVLNGNELVMYWFKSDLPLPSASRDLNRHRWTQVRSFNKLSFFATMALESTYKVFVATMITEVKRTAVINIIILNKDYSGLVTINKQIIDGKSIMEDIFLNKDRSWILIKQRGSAMMIHKVEAKRAEGLLYSHTEIHTPFEGTAIIGIYCTRMGMPFCVFESHGRYYLTEGEFFQGRVDKIPGYKTAAWTTSNNYVVLMIKNIHTQSTDKIVRKLVYFRRGFKGIYGVEELPTLNDWSLGDYQNNGFALLENGDDAILLKVKSMRPDQTDSNQPSLHTLITKKISITVTQQALQNQDASLVFKGSVPTEELPRGLFVDPGIYPPKQPDQPSESHTLLLIVMIVIVIVAAAGGYYAFMTYKKKKAKEDETKDTFYYLNQGKDNDASVDDSRNRITSEVVL